MKIKTDIQFDSKRLRNEDIVFAMRMHYTYNMLFFKGAFRLRKMSGQSINGV